MLPTSCPRCESEQPFKPRTRDTTQRWQEVVVHCHMCHWTKVINYTTPEIAKLERDVKRAYDRVDLESARFGWPSNSTAAMYDRLRERLRQARSELMREVIEHGSPVDQGAA